MSLGEKAPNTPPLDRVDPLTAAVKRLTSDLGHAQLEHAGIGVVSVSRFRHDLALSDFREGVASLSQLEIEYRPGVAVR